MSHSNKVVVYCVSDDGISLSTVHDKVLNTLAKWESLADVLGTISYRAIQSVAASPATLYPSLLSDGWLGSTRAKDAKKEPAPYLVSQHAMTVVSGRKQQTMVMAFFIGRNASLAFDEVDFTDVTASAMLNMNDEVSPVEDLASSSDGIDGLVYDVMKHAAFYPENEFEGSDYQKFDDEQVVMIAYYE